jgi:hypothetical protein
MPPKATTSNDGLDGLSAANRAVPTPQWLNCNPDGLTGTGAMLVL